jgi:hypothetical protein
LKRFQGPSPGYFSRLPFAAVPDICPDFRSAFAEALRLDAIRERAAAASILDDALKGASDAPEPLRFRALLLRAELAVDSSDLITGRGILSEAVRVPLTPSDRESLSAELSRANDLEAFLTHRGCAG